MQNKIKKKTNLKVFFLNLDVRPTMAGIEISSLKRSKIFCDLLGLDVEYLTIGLNNRLARDVELAKLNDRCSENLIVESIYDYFSKSSSCIPRQTHKNDLNFSATVDVEASPLDFIGYNEIGEMIAYGRRHDDLTLSYINYLSGGKIFRRETYDCNGFLIRSETIQPIGEGVDSLVDTFHDVLGKSKIVKLGTIKNNTAICDSIHLLDEDGRYLTSFKNEPELVEYWITKKVESEERVLLIIDRSNELFKPALAVKLKFPDKVKLVSIIHGVHTGGDIFQGPSNVWYGNALQDIDKYEAIVVLTDNQKLDIESRYIQSKGKVNVIPHAIDVNEKNIPLEKRKKYKIVYIARFSPEKNHLMAIDIFQKVLSKVPQAELHFYGFGQTEKDIKNKVNELNLGEKIFINEYSNDVNSIYLEAGLSILTSNVEGFCMSVLESLNCGCPVISFNIKYGPDIMIKNRVNGVLVNPFDLDNFADSIIEVLKDDKFHAHLINNASQSVLKYSSVCVSEMWDKLINDIFPIP